jgi:hypothetical protein
MKPASSDRSEPPDFTFIDLFAGIGDFGAALRRSAAAAFSPASGTTTARRPRANFPNDAHPIAGDIREVKEADIPAHDLLLAGFPCQGGTDKRTSPKERCPCLSRFVRKLEVPGNISPALCPAGDSNVGRLIEQRRFDCAFANSANVAFVTRLWAFLPPQDPPTADLLGPVAEEGFDVTIEESHLVLLRYGRATTPALLVRYFTLISPDVSFVSAIWRPGGMAGVKHRSQPKCSECH